MHAPLTVAVAQPLTTPGDVGRNAAAHAAAVHAAAGARVVVFPELSLSGYEVDVPLIELDDPAIATIAAACAATGAIALVGAPVAVDGEDRIATVAVSAEGSYVAYTKMCLGDAEATRFLPGTGPAVIEVDGWRLGLGICKDTRIPEHLDATVGQDIDAYVAGLVFDHDEVAEHDARAARIHALGGVPVAFANAAGFAGSAYPDAAGTSCIWDATGDIVARAGVLPDQVVAATLAPSLRSTR